jgi:hypothetical protein
MFVSVSSADTARYHTSKNFVIAISKIISLSFSSLLIERDSSFSNGLDICVLQVLFFGMIGIIT